MTDFTTRLRNRSPVPILPHQRWIFKRQTSTKVLHQASNLGRTTWRNQISLQSPVKQAMRIVRNPPRALELAKVVAKETPERGEAWFTLALAHYRNGDWQSADNAVQQSIRLARDGNTKTYNALLLATIRAQQGRAEEARQLHDNSRTWIAENQTDNDDLLRLASEAAALINVELTTTKK